MKIRLFSDATVDIDLASIQAAFANLSPSFTWSLGKTKVKLVGDYVEYPKTYKALSRALLNESVSDDFVVIFTEKPYDNNYFWESGREKAIIVSLYGWDHLTTLSRNNGAVYFIVALIVRALGIGQSHRGKNTGCINDFWQDKTGVDSGMRSAFICTKCSPPSKSKDTSAKSAVLNELMLVLDQLSSASRANKDVCDIWLSSKLKSEFQVFLLRN